METDYYSIPSYRLQLVRESDVVYPRSSVQEHGEAMTVARAYLEDRDSEHLAVLLLDGMNHLIGVAIVASGGISGCQVTMRDVLKFAIAGRASAFILAHNHPSGNVTPSKEDIAFTVKMKAGAELIGIPLVDHIIVSSGLKPGGMSFLNNGLL